MGIVNVNFFQIVIFQLFVIFFAGLHGLGAENSFPETVTCEAQSAYRFRTDGKPGREIIVTFQESVLSGGFSADVLVKDQKEAFIFPVKPEGYKRITVLLPDGIGTDSAVEATIILQQDKKSVQKTFVVPAVRHWNVYLYNHSHVDIGYTNTHDHVELLHKNNILEGIRLGEETRNFPKGSQYRWNPEVTWPLERLWTQQPEIRKSTLQAIRDGQLCVDAGYVNLNTSTCSDEELFYLFDFSRKMQKLTSKPMDVFQQMDIPGMSWGLVSVMAQQGVRYIMAWPNGGDRVGFTHQVGRKPFWWIGPDGKSKVLFLQPGNYANSGSMGKGGQTGRPWFGQRDVSKVPSIIKTGKANVNFIPKTAALETADYPFDFLVLSWSLWDNCPLDADIPEAVKAWNAQYAFPHIVIAGGHEIMAMIEQKYGDILPEVRGDFTEYWSDGLGTAAGLTAMNRQAKERLTQAETLWTLLRPKTSGARAQFDEAWRYVLLGSEHTWCFENPSEPYFQDAIWKAKKRYFHEADDRSQVLLDESLAPVTDQSRGALGPKNGPSNGGIAVFNTQSWARGGLIILSAAESVNGDKVTDEHGVELPAQRLGDGRLIFKVPQIPALSATHYRVIKGESTLSNGCRIRDFTLENDILRVTLDSETGNISSLTTISNHREYADSTVNGGLNAFRWLPANIDSPVADTQIVITVTEQGPLVSEFKVTSQGIGCRSVSRTVRLVYGCPWVEIENVVDKLPLVAKDGVHFGFGFHIPNGKTRIDIPWGIVDLEKDLWPQGNRNWFSMQRWLDISNDSAGITWCSLDASLFEVGKMTANISLSWGGRGPWLKEIKPSSTIYSWVMNNHWHTNFPLTQDGPVTFRYRILPHGEYNPVISNRFGLEQSQPLIHVAANSKPNLIPPLTIDNDSVYITIMKPSESGDAFLIRLRSLSNQKEMVRFTFPNGNPKSFHICELEDSAGDAVQDSVEMRPFGQLTLKIQF